jgi:hypothetical protein
MEIQQLRSTIQGEIQAKQQVEEELKQIKADIILKIEFVFYFYLFLSIFIK